MTSPCQRPMPASQRSICDRCARIRNAIPVPSPQINILDKGYEPHQAVKAKKGRPKGGHRKGGMKQSA